MQQFIVYTPGQGGKDTRLREINHVSFLAEACVFIFRLIHKISDGAQGWGKIRMHGHSLYEGTHVDKELVAYLHVYK